MTHLLVEYLKEKRVALLGIFIVCVIGSAALLGVLSGGLIFFFSAEPEFAILLAGGVVLLMLVVLALVACWAIHVELQMLKRILASAEDHAAPDG